MKNNKAGLLALIVLGIASLLMIFFVLPRISNDGKPIGDAINEAGNAVKNSVEMGGDKAGDILSDAAAMLTGSLGSRGNCQYRRQGRASGGFGHAVDQGSRRAFRRRKGSLRRRFRGRPQKGRGLAEGTDQYRNSRNAGRNHVAADHHGARCRRTHHRLPA